MIYQLNADVRNFGKTISKLSDVDIYTCYQCGKCTAGCPIVMEMSHTPNQIMRLIQLGLKEEVLNSLTPWLCAACETCTTRCPKGVDIAKIMDTLRILARKEGYQSKEPNVVKFNDIFLNCIKDKGRLQETHLAMVYNLKTKQFFKDADIGRKLFMKGKISLSSDKIKGTDAMKSIFERSRAFLGKGE
ncbi:MAG: 4Fe-4S dicluster domain-containing protein [Desulfobacterales bacterium]|nr:4Fe-4S dicluster domain-containing protein [Desulfobacterales bacterium]